jgi:hypothetical protein
MLQFQRMCLVADIETGTYGCEAWSLTLRDERMGVKLGR